MAERRNRCEAQTSVGHRCRQEAGSVVRHQGREYRLCILHARIRRYDGVFAPATEGGTPEVAHE